MNEFRLQYGVPGAGRENPQVSNFTFRTPLDANSYPIIYWVGMIFLVPFDF